MCDQVPEEDADETKPKQEKAEGFEKSHLGSSDSDFVAVGAA
jgi:hypothetical protein